MRPFPRTVLSIIAAGLVLSITAGLGRRVSAAPTEAHRRLACQRMVEETIIAAGVRDPRVLEAIAATPRCEFLPTRLRSRAYDDAALPIGGGQTISSPFIVALMTESLRPKPTDRVLEIGTGSGYQAAVLSRLVKEVYSVEIVELLGRRARRTLNRLKYDNVVTRIGDGFQGWLEHSPFDKIILTCSPPQIPPPLIEQLKEGGLLVAPVGNAYQQVLCRFCKRQGRLQRESLRPTLFVPMTGKAESSCGRPSGSFGALLVNGGFEKAPSESGFLPGWYYQRQLVWKSDAEAPEGRHYVLFQNELPGRAAHAMQGFPVDGRRVGELSVFCWVRSRLKASAAKTGPLYPLRISFYGEDRSDVGVAWLGPAPEGGRWGRLATRAPVPPRARQAVLETGLMGARGELAVDDLRIDPSPRAAAR